MTKNQDYCYLEKDLINSFSKALKSKRKDKNLMFELFYQACIKDVEETEEKLEQVVKK